MATDIKGKVIIMRIPAIFSEERNSGLLHEIKRSNKEKAGLLFFSDYFKESERNSSPVVCKSIGRNRKMKIIML